MNFILAANFIRHMPWTHAWWAHILATGLAQRGHTVDLVLDGTELPIDPAAAFRVHIARPRRIHLGAHPGRFGRLVQTLRQRDPAAVVLSLTPLVAGDLWLPIEPSPLQVARRLVRDLRPVSLALELAHHPWLPFEAWAAWRARHPRSIRLAFDGRPGTEPLPRVTTLTQPQADAAYRDAALVRARFDIPFDHALAALSLAEFNPRVLGSFLSDLAAAASKPLTILAATARPHTLTRLADLAGFSSTHVRTPIHLVPVTLTRSIHPLLAAADLALAPPPFASTPAGHSGRWIADALALGVPVLAHADAPGATLLDPATCWRTRAELLAHLARALTQTLAQTPAARHSRQAPTIPAHLALDRLLERVEALAARIRPDHSATVPSRAR